MLWAKWQATLTAAVFGAGLALCQGPPATPMGESAQENTLTVREPGKPDLKCRVYQVGRQPNGMTAYQVQATDTGEWLTILEAGPSTPLAGAPNGTCIRQVATQI